MSSVLEKRYLSMSLNWLTTLRFSDRNLRNHLNKSKQNAAELVGTNHRNEKRDVVKIYWISLLLPGRRPKTLFRDLWMGRLSRNETRLPGVDSQTCGRRLQRLKMKWKMETSGEGRGRREGATRKGNRNLILRTAGNSTPVFGYNTRVVFLGKIAKQVDIQKLLDWVMNGKGGREIGLVSWLFGNYLVCWTGMRKNKERWKCRHEQ